MRDRLTASTKRVTTTFASFTAGQKAVTIVAVVALAVGGYFFATWASKPTMAPLFSNLAAADAAAIVEKLNADGVPYELTGGGQTINVPQEQVYDLRIKLSGEGLPAQTDAATGYALLDKQGVMTSDFMQQVGYQRALEGELSKTIKSISGVTAATVHLALPKKDVFADDQKQPTASVLVATAPGKPLGSDKVQAVVNLVASSIEGLEPGNVTVVGADGKVLSTNAQNGAAAGSDARAKETQSYEQRLGSSVQNMLDQVVGPGHAVVQITADLDYDATETKTQRYVSDPNTPPLAESKKTEKYNGTGTPVGGVLGPDNIQVPGGNGGEGTYENSQETRNNAVGMVTEVRRSAPGSVRKLSVAVLVDSKTAGNFDEARVQQLVGSAVGLDAQRGDTIAVTAMPFDASASDAAKNALAESAKAEQQEQLYAMIKDGGAVAVILLLVLIAAYRNRRKNKRLRQLVKAEVAQIEHDPAMSAAIDAARAKLALESGGAPAGALAIEAAEPDPSELRQKEIAELVEKQPEEVAALLRGWLADRRS
jgi:flagellar M-ring protein FliF